ncbi:ATP/GTP-binding protein [Streptomyces sp. NBC_01619]|uniref:ATP/GTP-binding protein n=1 Tax=Streptomyces sp. NBC_01619 TaxID=2975901 RepID=UPI00224DCEDB|nr:ATP/GTP-binding protein [Streptomyces sp. NBC_01619]MCX4515933.1 ATP/GTP-binding protein [Streptomyces sp. NBC_01619]
MTLASAPELVWNGAVGLVQAAWALVNWAYVSAWWLGILGVALWCGWAWTVQRLAARALAERTYVELLPSRQFETDGEEILRFGSQLIRAAAAGPWWTPRDARTVRIRLRADGTKPLSYRIEGPASARHLLLQTPYDRVRCEPARPVRDKQRERTVRAVFVLHGLAGSRLRDVPLEPDPLQPLVDAVADLRADLGDLAEVCLDMSPASKWRLRARRWQVVDAARQQARRESRREARWMTQDAATMEDALSWQITKYLVPQEQRGGDGRRLLMTPRPPRVDREKALGKLVEDTGLVRVQLLVRCASNTVGRAERRLRHIEAALDVYGARTRLSSLGFSLGPFRFGPDRWPWRDRFDARWASGLIRPARSSWARIEELAGLLKPPTVHARLPLLAGDIPTYAPGKSLLPQGWHRGPDGRERLIATRDDDTLFEVQVGKAGWGKTMRALVQAVASAHGRRGLAFVDPHRDSWDTVAPYLAHPRILDRTWLFDLTIRDPQDRLACWNPLSMTGSGQAAHEVVAATVDAFATSLGWGDANAPRAITIFTKAVEALVAVNARAVAANAENCQATVFQIRPLLTDPLFRKLVVEQLEPEAARWWMTSFPEIPKDALPTVLNPLDRLAASPVIKAFLGSPTGSYDIRKAMDDSSVVWICPAGTGPTDRLLVSLLVRDMLRAGLSRRDTPERQRRPFRLYLDELISLDGAASTSLAEITEQLRKFRVRMHGMTQLLHRLSPDVRTALLQNASCLSTTAGSVEAIRHITNEWGDQVNPDDAAELDRYHHWASFTVAGKRIGPLLIRGPELSEVFDDLARPGKVRALAKAAHTNTEAQPLAELTKVASNHEKTVRDFLAGRGAGTGQGGQRPTTQGAAAQNEPSADATDEGQYR